jgi:hypothetical protein
MYEMPDTMVALLGLVLEQGNAHQNGPKKRILDLESEVNDIENKYQEIFIAE